MPSLIANVGRLDEEAAREFPLHTQAEVHRIRYAEIRIYRADAGEWRQRRSRATRRIRDVAVLKLRLGNKRRQVNLRKNQVALDLIVEHAEAPTNGSLAVVERRIGKAKSRPQLVCRPIKATRCSGRNGRQDSGAGADSSDLIRRNAAAGAHQSIEPIPTFSRIDVATGTDDGDRLGRIIKARIKVRHVVLMGEGRRIVIEARAKLQAQLRSYLPTVRPKRLKLIEAEKSNRIIICFIVSPKVPQQRIGERITCGPGVATGAESNVAGIARSPVLVFAIANVDDSHLHRVLSVDQGKVVACRDVGGRRQQRSRWAAETGKSGDVGIRNAIVETAAGEKLRIGKTVGLALPKFAHGRYPLAVVGDVNLSFVDFRRTD